nr:hypothetical protein 8 [bacterium]
MSRSASLLLLLLIAPLVTVLPLQAKPVQLECQFYSSDDDEPGAPFQYSLDTTSGRGTGREDGSEPSAVSVVWNADRTVTIVDESESVEAGVRKRIRDEVVINAATGKAQGVLLIQEGEVRNTYRANGTCQPI